MSDFTPGPWNYSRAHYPADGEYDYGIGASVNGETKCIAEAFGRVSTDGRPDAEANARLIAASPELLDGCNALEGLFVLLLGRDDLPPAVRAVMETNHRRAEARAAIAKATHPTTQQKR